MAPVAVGVLWSWMLNGEYGTFNAVLYDLGLIDDPIHWLADGRLAFNMVALAHIWNQAPLASLLILAGLQSMPENLHRAARIDGAGAFRRFFSITLPWLRPMLLLIMILTTINSIMAFDLFWIMTRGGPGSATTVFSWMGYAYAFQFFKFGEGAAILYVLTILCLILAALYLKLFFPTVTGSRASATGAARESLAATLVNRIGGSVRTKLEPAPGPAPPRAVVRHTAPPPWPGRPGTGRSTDLRVVVRAVPVARRDEPLAVGRPRAHAADRGSGQPDPGELPFRPVPDRCRGRPVERPGDPRALRDLQFTSWSRPGSPRSISCSARSPATPTPAMAAAGS